MRRKNNFVNAVLVIVVSLIFQRVFYAYAEEVHLCDPNNGELGFCVTNFSYLGPDPYACFLDDDLELRMNNHPMWGCTFTGHCCYPKNGLEFRKGNTCLGHERCQADPTQCKTPFVNTATTEFALDVCDDGQICCDETIRQEDLYGEVCEYYAGGSSHSGVCLGANECKSSEGQGSCMSGRCCSEIYDCSADLGGTCVSDRASCSTGVSYNGTSCTSTPSTPVCCDTEVSCEESGFVCDWANTCVSSGGIINNSLTCDQDGSTPPEVCCMNSAIQETCSDRGGYCTMAECPIGSLLFPNSVYDPCDGGTYTGVRCCGKSVGTCSDLGGIGSGVEYFQSCMRGLGRFILANDATYCCILDQEQMETEFKPKDIVYRGPVIESLEGILGPVTRILYYGGLALGIFFIILSGYRLMTSEGDPQRVKGAQEQLTSAIIGIVFILLSVTIIRVIIDEIINL